jgi:hypothetical protein
MFFQQFPSVRVVPEDPLGGGLWTSSTFVEHYQIVAEFYFPA